MKSPIIIIESFDISIHPSSSHAARHLEVWDVEDDIYKAYDSDGQLLNIFVELVEINKKFLWFKWNVRGKIVQINEFEPRRYDLLDLRIRLIKYLKSQKIPDEELMKLSTEELITNVGKYMPWRLNTK
jgi:hypothetical protein